MPITFTYEPDGRTDFQVELDGAEMVQLIQTGTLTVSVDLYSITLNTAPEPRTREGVRTNGTQDHH